MGIGDVPTRMTYSGRSVYGRSAEAARMAIEDAGPRYRGPQLFWGSPFTSAYPIRAITLFPDIRCRRDITVIHFPELA